MAMVACDVGPHVVISTAFKLPKASCVHLLRAGRFVGVRGSACALPLTLMGRVPCIDR